MLVSCSDPIGDSNLDAAEKTYLRVLEIDSTCRHAFGYLGLVHHLQGRIEDAIVRYHEALALNPLNMHLLDLLALALDASADNGLFSKTADEEFAARMRAASAKEAAFREIREKAIAANKGGSPGLFFGVPPGPDMYEGQRLARQVPPNLFSSTGGPL